MYQGFHIIFWNIKENRISVAQNQEQFHNPHACCIHSSLLPPRKKRNAVPAAHKKTDTSIQIGTATIAKELTKTSQKYMSPPFITRNHQQQQKNSKSIFNSQNLVKRTFYFFKKMKDTSVLSNYHNSIDKAEKPIIREASICYSYCL